MKEETKRIPILQLTEQGTSRIKDIVVREFPLTIFLNDQELVTLLCSPTNLKYLVIGFLLSEGLIKGKGEIKKIIVDDQKGEVLVEAEEGKGFSGQFLFKRLVTSGGGRGASFCSAPDAKCQARIESEIEISFSLMDDFVHRSEVFKATGGVHSATLCDKKGILVFTAAL